MKLSAFVLRFTLAVLPCTPAFASQPSDNADLDAVIALPTNAAVAHGMSRESVEFAMGTPGAQLSPDVWVYWDFKAKKLPGSEAYDTLVVGFSGNRVTFLRLTRNEIVRTFIHQQKTRARQAKLATASLSGQEKYAEAEPLLVQGLQGLQRSQANIPPYLNATRRITESLERLVQLYDAWGKPTQAAGWKTKLAKFEQEGKAAEKKWP